MFGTWVQGEPLECAAKAVVDGGTGIVLQNPERGAALFRTPYDADEVSSAKRAGSEPPHAQGAIQGPDIVIA